MADKKISELTALSAAPESDDYFVILDIDANATKKIAARYMFGVPTYYTPTFDGWTSTPNNVCRYTLIGKTCITVIDITAGTSDGTDGNIATATLPFTSKNVANITWEGACGLCADNGSFLTTPCRWAVVANSDIVSFYSNMSGGAWTKSGTKLIHALVIYEIG